MLELVKYVVNQFAEERDQVEIKQEERENAIVITIVLASSDMGKVIGKQGKIAKALRTLVRAATPKDSKKYIIEIQERDTGKTDSDNGEEAAE